MSQDIPTTPIFHTHKPTAILRSMASGSGKQLLDLQRYHLSRINRTRHISTRTGVPLRAAERASRVLPSDPPYSIPDTSHQALLSAVRDSHFLTSRISSLSLWHGKRVRMQGLQSIRNLSSSEPGTYGKHEHSNRVFSYIVEVMPGFHIVVTSEEIRQVVISAFQSETSNEHPDTVSRSLSAKLETCIVPEPYRAVNRQPVSQ